MFEGKCSCMWSITVLTVIGCSDILDHEILNIMFWQEIHDGRCGRMALSYSENNKYYKLLYRKHLE
jgi:hypothetical protein